MPIRRRGIKETKKEKGIRRKWIMTKYLNCWNTLCGYKIHSINNKRGLHVNNKTNVREGESKNRGSRYWEKRKNIAKFSMWLKGFTRHYFAFPSRYLFDTLEDPSVDFTRFKTFSFFYLFFYFIYFWKKFFFLKNAIKMWFMEKGRSLRSWEVNKNYVFCYWNIPTSKKNVTTHVTRCMLMSIYIVIEWINYWDTNNK